MCTSSSVADASHFLVIELIWIRDNVHCSSSVLIHVLLCPRFSSIQCRGPIITGIDTKTPTAVYLYSRGSLPIYLCKQWTQIPTKGHSIWNSAISIRNPLLLLIYAYDINFVIHQAYCNSPYLLMILAPSLPIASLLASVGYLTR